MAYIITTLHPENNQDIDLYPNIKTENIPNGGVTPEKLSNSNFEEFVYQWLDEHPEATTSVQDGSLTYAKLVRGTLGFVTPEMFGAVGDGINNDTIALTSCFWYCYQNSTPCFLTKIYAVNKMVQISFDCYMSKNSKIIALEQPYDSQNNKTPLVLIGAYHTNDANISINVDGGGVCDITIDVSLCRRCKINAHVYNFKDKGFYFGRTDSGNNENVINVWAYGINNGENLSNYGVYITSGDSVFGEIITVDCKIGVYTNVLLVCNQIHCWLKDENYYNDSIGLVVTNGWTHNQTQINYFYQDGVKIGVKTLSSSNIHINLFTYVPPYSFQYDYNEVVHVVLTNSSYANIETVRIRTGSNYDDVGYLKFTKDNKYSVMKLGDVNGAMVRGSGRYRDIDSLPDCGIFSVDNVTTPISGNNVTVICTSTGNAKQQIILYGGSIYIRFWQIGSADSWGVWRTITNTPI